MCISSIPLAFISSFKVPKFPFEEVPPSTKQTKQDADSASPVLESADPGSAPGSGPASDMGPRAGSGTPSSLQWVSALVRLH